ncbi:sulfite exporter TauE/SafE family protein [Actinomadura sp. NEAU-AAG7]|uniref:urease accessory protein UreH domain-containing protein n=1 Tax=Actinomadura sp. NEAU-AAG7 TaxID=2839640 RepID=UPI001BE3D33B|nr:sulfite exporter TauE/SafE family protein [Actinomadura sp. NEAU-AAG7]MBT2207091.1 sulfite exporter TauE/SafE family protein [Actinomadura sp. NEAU-AAG7]
MDITPLFLAGAGMGLTAGGTTCAAVQFGLLTGAIRDGGGPRPVASFLTAKLASHTVLGALLGLAGGAVQPGPRVRGALLTAAALVLALFALDLLGFGPARRLPRRRSAAEPVPAEGRAGLPGHCAPSMRPQTRRRRPWALGAATVLVPCGLTLSAELLAVTSRSALGGAVVMGAFVLGTAPLFGLAGLAAGRVLAVLRGRLAALPALVLVVAAGWTLLSGLRLGGRLPSGGGTASAADSARFVRTDASGTQVVTVWALDQGYRPALATARAGVPTVLVLRTHGTRGHTRAFTIPGRGKDVILPENGDTRIDLGTPGPGRMRFVCASGHFPGAITFR